MATQILQRGAAHWQLVAKGSRLARKEGHWACPGLQVPLVLLAPSTSQDEAAAAIGEEGLWQCLLQGGQSQAPCSQ